MQRLSLSLCLLNSEFRCSFCHSSFKKRHGPLPIDGMSHLLGTQCQGIQVFCSMRVPFTGA